MAAGARVVEIEVPIEHPLAKFIGMFKDDPLMDQWREAVEEFRRERDAEPDPRW